MKSSKFIARYDDNGITKSIFFDRAKFTKKSASRWMNEKGIQNFFFFFEPEKPTAFGENGLIFKGEVGFDITTEALLDAINDGMEIYLDTFGGDLWEGLKIHDAIKTLGTNPRIEAMGTVASSGVQILLSTQNRYMSENSRILIHNPWAFTAGDDTELRETAAELEIEKNNLANLYSGVSGRPVENMLQIMKEERFMYIDEAKNLNFVKAKVGATPTKEEQTIKIDNDMNTEETKELGLIKSALNKLANVLNPPKNVVIQDVNGTEIDFTELETSEQIAVGSTATVAGAPATGEYVIEDGTTYVFEAGTLTEIREPEMEEEVVEDEAAPTPEEQQAEIEALQTENETLKTEVQNLIADRDAMREKFTNELATVTDKLNAFVNTFSEEDQEPPTPPADGKKTKSKFSYKKK